MEKEIKDIVYAGVFCALERLSHSDSSGKPLGVLAEHFEEGVRERLYHHGCKDRGELLNKVYKAIHWELFCNNGSGLGKYIFSGDWPVKNTSPSMIGNKVERKRNFSYLDVKSITDAIMNKYGTCENGFGSSYLES